VIYIAVKGSTGPGGLSDIILNLRCLSHTDDLQSSVVPCAISNDHTALTNCLKSTLSVDKQLNVAAFYMDNRPNNIASRLQ